MVVQVSFSCVENNVGELEIPVEWIKFEHTLPPSMRAFAIEFSRGGEHEFSTINDVCIDDFHVRTYPCGRTYRHPTPLSPPSNYLTHKHARVETMKKNYFYFLFQILRFQNTSTRTRKCPPSLGRAPLVTNPTDRNFVAWHKTHLTTSTGSLKLDQLRPMARDRSTL